MVTTETCTVQASVLLEVSGSAGPRRCFGKVEQLASLEQIDNVDVQRNGQILHCEQGRVTASALDIAEISAIHTRPEREFFLRQTGRGTVTANISANQFAKLHPPTGRRLSTISLSDIVDI
ncbi:hypothetical protein ASE72_19060 [Sphingomonas sp. Leaf20]|nr:hypothetical protein ASE72_19060 [Sphingomonas sp. Leaf20]